MSDLNPTHTESSPRKGLTAGILLIVIGLGLFIFQFIGWPFLFPLLLGGGLLVSGILTRKTGLIIPGGILTGVGLAIVAVQNDVMSMAEPLKGGLFLLVFSLGWFLIPLVTGLVVRKTEWWALIPGTILAGIGGLVMAGDSGLEILKIVGQYWPVILVVIGASILIKNIRKN
jgi:hypothetical protein